MLVATFKSTTDWAGRKISHQNGDFMFEGNGQLAPSEILDYDKCGHIEWANDTIREAVVELAARELTNAKLWPLAEEDSGDAASRERSHARRLMSGVIVVAIALLLGVGVLAIMKVRADGALQEARTSPQFLHSVGTWSGRNTNGEAAPGPRGQGSDSSSPGFAGTGEIRLQLGNPNRPDADFETDFYMKLHGSGGELDFIVSRPLDPSAPTVSFAPVMNVWVSTSSGPISFTAEYDDSDLFGIAGNGEKPFVIVVPYTFDGRERFPPMVRAGGPWKVELLARDGSFGGISLDKAD
jgi:hypothetical protein